MSQRFQSNPPTGPPPTQSPGQPRYQPPPMAQAGPQGPPMRPYPAGTQNFAVIIRMFVFVPNSMQIAIVGF